MTHRFLVVLDKPSAPKGPFSVSNLTASSADLEWKPTTKDNGSPVTGYVIESRPSTRARWSKVAKMDDNTTKYSPKDLIDYLFRVSAVNEEGQVSPLETKEPVRLKRKIGKSLHMLKCMLKCVR